MHCPQNEKQLTRSNDILDATEKLIEIQGLVSFKLSDVIRESGCANTSFYQLFESKEDLIVCTFLRNATSNYFQEFIDQNPNLSSFDKILLPIIFTFESLHFSPIFNMLRQVAVNPMIWSLSSSEKNKILTNKINSYWSWIHHFYNESVKNGDLIASEKEILELTQGTTFFLTGSLCAFESKLINPKYLNEKRLTLFRHLQLLFKPYNWNTSLELRDFERIGMKANIFFKNKSQEKSTCERCMKQQKSSLSVPCSL